MFPHNLLLLFSLYCWSFFLPPLLTAKQKAPRGQAKCTHDGFQRYPNDTRPQLEQLAKMSLTVCGSSGLEKCEENPGQNAIMSLHNEN